MEGTVSWKVPSPGEAVLALRRGTRPGEGNGAVADFEPEDVVAVGAAAAAAACASIFMAKEASLAKSVWLELRLRIPRLPAAPLVLAEPERRRFGELFGSAESVSVVSLPISSCVEPGEVLLPPMPMLLPLARPPSVEKELGPGDCAGE